MKFYVKLLYVNWYTTSNDFDHCPNTPKKCDRTDENTVKPQVGISALMMFIKLFMDGFPQDTVVCLHQDLRDETYTHIHKILK